MTVNEGREGKLCRVAPLVLSLMQLSSTAAWVSTETKIAGAPTTQLEAILFTLWIMVSLSPVLLLFLIRRICALISMMAVPIVATFCGRIYYTLLFLESKSLPQMGDWAIWLNHLFGAASAVIVIGWMFVRTIVFTFDHFRSHNR